MATRRAMPVLQVRDVMVATEFYEQLGFASHGAVGDPPAFNIVQRGEVTIALDRAQNGLVPLNQLWAAYLYIDDAEALHAEFVEYGIEPSDIVRPALYGCIEFDIIDPDGHRIAFGQSLNPVPGPGLSTDWGRG